MGCAIGAVGGATAAACGQATGGAGARGCVAATGAGAGKGAGAGAGKRAALGCAARGPGVRLANGSVAASAGCASLPTPATVPRPTAAGTLGTAAAADGDTGLAAGVTRAALG